MIRFYFFLLSLFLTVPCYSFLTPYKSLNRGSFNQVVQELRNPYQLYHYIENEFHYRDVRSERTKNGDSTSDWWQSPEKTFNLKTGNCSDYAIFCTYVLTKHGYESYWVGLIEQDFTGHAVTMFKWKGLWHVIGNTSQTYNEYDGSWSMAKVISNNCGARALYSSIPGIVSSTYFQDDYTKAPSMEWINLSRVTPQLFVSQVQFISNRNDSVEFSINPVLSEKNKLSLSWMHQFIPKTFSAGVGYSIHGFYLSLFSGPEFFYLNHVVYLHSLFWNRIGVSIYYDISQRFYSGIDLDGKLFSFQFSKFKVDSFLALRNGFQCVDAEIRVIYNKQFKLELFKLDDMPIARFSYSVDKNFQSWNFYADSNLTIGTEFCIDILKLTFEANLKHLF